MTLYVTDIYPLNFTAVTRVSIAGRMKIIEDKLKLIIVILSIDLTVSHLTIIAQSFEDMQEIDSIASSQFGLKVIISKAELLPRPARNAQQLLTNVHTLTRNLPLKSVSQLPPILLAQ